jgi:ribosomal protein S18 acetylase RimI-like enzyme
VVIAQKPAYRGLASISSDKGLKMNAALNTTVSSPFNGQANPYAANPYAILPLTAPSSAYMDLHQHVVYEAVRKGKGHFVKRWMHKDVRDHFAKGHGALGAYAGKKIVGQMFLTKAEKPGTKHLGGYPIELPEETLVIQAMGVHAQCRGSDLGKTMLKIACDMAVAGNRKIIIGKTAEDNNGGIRTFEAAGFEKSGPATFVNGDSYKSFFMTKTLG